MLTHVVMFRFIEPGTDGPRIAAMLNAMDGRIPTLRSVAAGTNVLPSTRSWDLALVTTFDDLDGLEAYRTHPVHVEVLQEIQAAATEIAAVDFHS